MINLTIDNVSVSVKENTTILKAATEMGILIPTLCSLKEINNSDKCGMCVVEVDGEVMHACSTLVREGMEVFTNTKKINNIRKTILELVFASIQCDCEGCYKEKDCRLNFLNEIYSPSKTVFKKEYEIGLDETSSSITKDLSKCIKCGRCVKICKDKVGAAALSFVDKGKNAKVTTSFDLTLKESDCINCGQCIRVCPTDALKEKSKKEEMQFLLDEETYYNICLLSHNAYEYLAEGLNIESSIVKGRIVDILNKLGFDEVIDYDEYIVKEMMAISYVLQNNLLEGKPLFNACSGGIRREIIEAYPEAEELFVNVANIRKDINERFKESYLDRKIDKDVHLTRVGNCTAFLPNGNEHCGYDISITTNELAKLIIDSNIDVNEAESKSIVSLDYTGIFNPYFLSVSTAYGIIRFNDSSLIKNVKGAIKEFEYEVNETLTIKGAVVTGVKEAKEEIRKVLNKESEYNFVSVIPCEGGCTNGGGRPRHL